MKEELKCLYLKSQASTFIESSVLPNTIRSKFTPLFRSQHLILDRIDFLQSQISFLTRSILNSMFITQKTLIQTCDQIGLPLTSKKKCQKKEHYLNQIIKSNKLSYLHQKLLQHQQQYQHHSTKHKNHEQLSTMYSEQLSQKISNLCIIEQTITNVAINECVAFITSFEDLDFTSIFWLKRNQQKIMTIFAQIKAWHIQYQNTQKRDIKDIEDILASTLSDISILNQESDFDF